MKTCAIPEEEKMQKTAIHNNKFVAHPRDKWIDTFYSSPGQENHHFGFGGLITLLRREFNGSKSLLLFVSEDKGRFWLEVDLDCDDFSDENRKPDDTKLPGGAWYHLLEPGDSLYVQKLKVEQTTLNREAVMILYYQTTFLPKLNS